MGTGGRDSFRHLRETPPEGLLESRTAVRDGWTSMQVVRAGKVYIFGGGHVSQALVPVIAAAGFRPVVYDDRPEFSDPALFPAAEETLCGDFKDISQRVTVTADDYVVVMTRGHQADCEVLAQTLRSGAKYLGCIGSRKKLALCRERLLAAGFTDSFRHLHPDATGMYSWWSMRFRARERNAGWRIDYFLVSSRLADKIEKADILMEVMGSDHCPVELDINL